MPSRFGSVIATRKLHTAGPRQGEVTISLAKPTREPGGDWVCRFRIEGLGCQRLNFAHGVDAFQALQLALEAIRLMIDESGRKLTWVEAGRAGFPRYVPSYFGPVFERRLNRHIDREVLRFARAQERRYKARTRSRTR